MNCNLKLIIHDFTCKNKNVAKHLPSKVTASQFSHINSDMCMCVLVCIINPFEHQVALLTQTPMTCLLWLTNSANHVKTHFPVNTTSKNIIIILSSNPYVPTNQVSNTNHISPICMFQGKSSLSYICLSHFWSPVTKFTLVVFSFFSGCRTPSSLLVPVLISYIRGQSS